MQCPKCLFGDSKVIDSRSADDGSSIRRRRECLECQHRFTTYERVAENSICVIKKDGSPESFDRNKLLRGLLIACAKRPIEQSQLMELIVNLEKQLRSQQITEITSNELGNRVMLCLKNLDEVAFVRFASVYKDFQKTDEFSEFLS